MLRRFQNLAGEKIGEDRCLKELNEDDELERDKLRECVAYLSCGRRRRSKRRMAVRQKTAKTDSITSILILIYPSSGLSGHMLALTAQQAMLQATWIART